MAKAGPKLALNEKKLKALFSAMMIAPQNRYIAYALGVTKAETIKYWYDNGKNISENFSELLEPLDELFSFEYEAIFEQRRLEFDAHFRQLYDLEPEEKIPDRLKLDYYNFMLNEKRKFIENNISRKEDDFLKTIKLSEDETLDREFKLYLKFFRIYDRAKCVKEIGYLQNIDKHAGTSKNVGLSLKLLEKMNKEDFGEQPIQQNTKIELGNKSILAIAIQSEAQEKAKLLENKQENVIDVTPVNLLTGKTVEESN